MRSLAKAGGGGDQNVARHRVRSSSRPIEDHDPLGLDPVRTKLAFSVGHFLRPFIGFLNCKAYFGA
jgi:hypothetical protein